MNPIWIVSLGTSGIGIYYYRSRKCICNDGRKIFFHQNKNTPFYQHKKAECLQHFYKKSMCYMCKQYHLVFKTMLFIPKTLCTWLVLDTCFLLVHEGENVWLNTNVKRYDIMYTLSEKTTLQKILEKVDIRYKIVPYSYLK